jgi:proteasome lid subunit RPN8/RPN11
MTERFPLRRLGLLTISKKFAEEMVAHAKGEDPNECCGILAGKDGTIHRLYRITNTTLSPYRYLMDPQEFLNADKDSELNGWEFLAFYHSHTHGPAYPSQTDVRMALESGWLDLYYVLVSLENKERPDLRAFHIHESSQIVEDRVKVV